MLNLRKLALLLCLFLLVINQLNAQTFSDSNLPIIVINTNGNEIPDDPKVMASMKIVFRGEGQRNYLTDQTNPEFLNYDGDIGIELRGSSSQSFDKKPYGLETRTITDPSTGAYVNRNVSLLGMPKENDWVLNSCAFDDTFIKDFLTYKLARDIGHYAARGVYCEVVVNDEYMGLYILQEKIKVDENRVNIEEVTPNDNMQPNISGGYIIKSDKTTGGDVPSFYMEGRSGFQTAFIFDSPETNVVTEQQKTYVESVFRSLETAANDNNESIIDGFPSIIDIPTFVDFMLLNEYGSNADAYTYSSFYYKDRGGKLRAGPVWDFNFAYGVDAARSKTDVWQFSNDDNEGPLFFKQLFENPTFNCYLTKRWKELNQPGMPFNPDGILPWISNTETFLAEAISRNNIKWGRYPKNEYAVGYMSDWIRERNNWMSANIGSDAACGNPSVPQLVINEIMYNPPGSSDNQEFIELKNAGAETIDLTGIYISGLGISYQFPAESSLASGGLLVLADNTKGFEAQYSFAPFGEYSRKLPNNSFGIQLADAWGNIIDFVQYTDSSPWPKSADGEGKSLELTDAKLDNNVAENWFVRFSDYGSPGVDNVTGSLPVNLISFTGKNVGDYHLLQWETSNETNNAYFEIEKSIDGRNFEKIGERIAGAGFSSQKLVYEFQDSNVTESVSYYRLNQVDLNGKMTKYRAIAVTNSNFKIYTLYPNPVKNEIMVDAKDKNFNYDIQDMNGKTVSKGQSTSSKAINVEALKSGLYFINFGKETTKFVKE